jgi:hypothetical protein
MLHEHIDRDVYIERVISCLDYLKCDLVDKGESQMAHIVESAFEKLVDSYASSKYEALQSRLFTDETELA